MKNKDPLAARNPNESIHEKDTMSIISNKEGKETSRSKSSRK